MSRRHVDVPRGVDVGYAMRKRVTTSCSPVVMKMISIFVRSRVKEMSSNDEK